MRWEAWVRSRLVVEMQWGSGVRHGGGGLGSWNMVKMDYLVCLSPQLCWHQESTA
jgi:hypothetical protein